MDFDAMIIGGSYAGMSAALQLARGRRRVLVADAGERRNRFAHSSHGFLSQDGRPPDAIFNEARDQLMRYPTVTWLKARVDAVERADDGFRLTTDEGERHAGRRLVLATGVEDELPEVRGLSERWGTSVFHCPYCHGYELGEGRIGVIASSEHSMHHGLMMPDWGEATLFLNASFEPDEQQRAQLEARGTRIVPGRIREIAGKADVVLEGGETIGTDGLFTLTRTSIRCQWVQALGCEIEKGPLGSFIKTDDTQETSGKGVFACGDVARPSGSIALAVGEGAVAGIAAHHSLMTG